MVRGGDLLHDLADGGLEELEGGERVIRQVHEVDDVPIALDEHLVVGEGRGPDVRDAASPDRFLRRMLSAGGGEPRSGSVGRASDVRDVVRGSGIPCRGSCAIGDAFPLEDPEVVRSPGSTRGISDPVAVVIGRVDGVAGLSRGDLRTSLAQTTMQIFSERGILGGVSAAGALILRLQGGVAGSEGVVDDDDEEPRS